MPDSPASDEATKATRQGVSRHRMLALGAAVVAVAIAVALALSSSGTRQDGPVALPPILPEQGAAAGEGRVVIPEGFLMAEATAKRPLHEQGARWTRTDGLRGLPPLVSPCGGSLPSDAAAIGGRQVALIHPMLWKAERLVVYRDKASARRALAERRAALARCARHDDGGGTATVWRWEPLRIGEEAMFVGGQRYRGSQPVHGHLRGILMRQGRALVMYVDFGQFPKPPQRAEVAGYERAARLMAARLAAAHWAA